MIKKIIFFTFAFLTSIIIVKADYECVYDFNQSKIFGGTAQVEKTLKVNTTDKKFDLSGLTNSVFHVADSGADKKYTDEYLIDTYLEEKNCPEKIYACEAGFQNSIWYIAIINPSIITDFPENGGFRIYNNHRFKISECDIAILDEEKSSGIKMNVEFSCEFLGQLLRGDESKNIEGLEQLYCATSDDNCTANKIDKYNERKEELINYCRSIFKYADYVNPCVNECLNLQDYIEKIEDSSSTVEPCGLSTKLLVWIINIVKWVKYIVPVIVILFGMVDFIRALLSEKDDEMKKAQGRFVRRLIAAALIFIVPLVLTFILEKMGFSANMCGINF